MTIFVFRCNFNYLLYIKITHTRARGTMRLKEQSEKIKLIKLLAIDACAMAFSRVIDIAQNEVDNKVALAACQIILDRGLGKPSQAVEISGELSTARYDATKLSTLELAAIVSAAKRAEIRSD